MFQIASTITDRIAKAHVVRFDGAYLELKLEKKEGLTFGKLYGILEQLKTELPIREYSCKLSTLEQIFV